MYSPRAHVRQPFQSNDRGPSVSSERSQLHDLLFSIQFLWAASTSMGFNEDIYFASQHSDALASETPSPNSLDLPP